MCGMLDVTLEDDPIQPDPIISDPPSVQVPTLNINALGPDITQFGGSSRCVKDAIVLQSF